MVDIVTEQNQDLRWYIVHTYSGQEERVKKNLELRIQSLDMQDRIYQVIIPTCLLYTSDAADE